MVSFFEKVGEKAIDYVTDFLKTKRAPKRQVAQALLQIREAIVRCHAAYEEYQRQPDSVGDYYEAIGQLIRSLYLVRHILPVLDPKLAATISNYTGDEIDYYIYPLVTEGLLNYRKLEERLFDSKIPKEYMELQKSMDNILKKEQKEKSRYVSYQELSEKDKELFNKIALSWGSTGESPDFKRVIGELDEFLRKTFTIDEMW